MKKRENQDITKETFYTPIEQERQSAIDKKIKLLHGNFFGRPIAKFDIGQVRDVFIPYCYLVYHFNVERKVPIFKKAAERTGEVGIVFDLNESHPFQYDIYESGDPKLVSGLNDKRERVRLKSELTAEDILKQSQEFVQNRIMKRVYGSNGTLELKKKQFFYRPAVEMEVIYKGENINKKYVYLDEFGVQNEHILGLRYRVQNNF